MARDLNSKVLFTLYFGISGDTLQFSSIREASGDGMAHVYSIRLELSLLSNKIFI
ncbi:MAG: hypothetical protein HWN81_11545 [Candidatus Lokiarchaeota archaeon]|nr:hypothetical protein [Candidatus Lokiarchaeota archaeon]